MEKLPKAVEKGLEEITQEVTKKWAKGNETYTRTIMNFLKENILSKYLELGKDIDLKEGNYVRTLMVLYVYALTAVNGDMERFMQHYNNPKTLEPREDEIRRLQTQSSNRGSYIYDNLFDAYQIEVNVAKRTRWATAGKLANKK